VEFLAAGPSGRFDSSYWYYQPAEDRIAPHVAEKIKKDEESDGIIYQLKW